MRRFLVVFSLIFLSILISRDSISEVYVNRELLECDPLIYETKQIELYDETLSLTADYQNAYGECCGFTPGPPFIIEKRIIISSVKDENGYAVKMGSLVIDNSFNNLPAEVVIQGPDNDIIWIIADGNFIANGSAGGPVIFNGNYTIQSTYNGGNDPENLSAYSLDFQHCEFRDFDVYRSTPPIYLQGGHARFDNCRFVETDYTGNIVLYNDPYHTGTDERVWRFSMTNCQFLSCTFGSELCKVSHVIDFNFSNNHFDGNTSNIDPEYYDNLSLARLSHCTMESVEDNTAGDNVVNLIWLGSGTVKDEAVISSSDQLPIRVGTIKVKEEGSLEISPGSILKMTDSGGYPCFHNYGEMLVDGAVFTHYEDDSYGGDSDLETQPENIYLWGFPGIKSFRDATLELRNSTICHSRDPVIICGTAAINNCTFTQNEGDCISFSPETECDLYLSNSTIENNLRFWTSSVCGVNAYLADATGPVNMVFRGLDIQSNDGSGMELITVGSSHPTSLYIGGCNIDGNLSSGILCQAGAELDEVVIINNHIAANGGNGIYIYDYDYQDASVRCESNVIIGNGHSVSSGYNMTGAYIHLGSPRIINNTFACNRGTGLDYTHRDAGISEVVNNILHRNGGYGCTKLSEELPRFAHNIFWENEGSYQMYLYTPDDPIRTIAELQALGGEYATNDYADPGFGNSLDLAIAVISYQEDGHLSTIKLTQSGVFEEGELEGCIVKPDKNEHEWYLIKNNHEDTLFAAGDATAVAVAGDTCRIFDYHLAPGSGMRDLGTNDVVQTVMDIDGEHRIIDGNNDQNAVVDIGGDEFNPETFSMLVLSPEEGEHLIPGEQYDITWSTVGIDYIDILLYSHFDSSEESVEQIDSGLPGSNGHYQWTVPDTLSAKCKIEICDSDDFMKSACSGLFKIRGYQLARIGPTGEYEVFKPGRDGWQFGNTEINMWPECWWSQFDYVNGIDPYTGDPYPYYFSSILPTSAEPSDFPSWPLFVETHGVDQCYFDSPHGLQYRPSAVQRWVAIKGKWKGSCFGFSVSSLLAYDDRDAFLFTYPEVEPFERLFSLPLTEGHRETVNRIFLAQYGANFYNRVIGNVHKSLMETLDDIKQMLISEERDDRWLWIENRGVKSGAHAMVPYRLEVDSSSPSMLYIYVYDPNLPNDATARVEVGTVGKFWYYDKLKWGGDTLLSLGDPVSNYLSPPLMLTNTGPEERQVVFSAAGESQEGTPLNGAGNSFFQCYSTPGASITINDSEGRSIGFADSSTFNDIPDAFPIIPLTGGYHPPVGYQLPAGEYRMEVYDFPDSSFLFTFFEDSLTYVYGRTGVNPSQRDRICCGEEMKIINDDGGGKSFDTGLITVGESEERVYQVLGLGLDGSDSLTIAPLGKDSLEIFNPGPVKQYQLRLRLASTELNGEFSHADITLPSDASQTLIPVWSDLANSEVKILIDNGDDGTVDDSVLVDNQYVATLLQYFDYGIRGSCVEITWRLSEIDQDAKFEVLRSGPGSSSFEHLETLGIQRNGLTFKVRDSSIQPGCTYVYRIDYTAGGMVNTLFKTGPVEVPPMPLTLFQNYPNPFNPSTTIEFYLPGKEMVTLNVYDTAGRLISRLANSSQDAGLHKIEWNSTNNEGRRVESGIYFYRLKAGKKTIVRKMVLIR
jgi:hypothetical protein